MITLQPTRARLRRSWSYCRAGAWGDVFFMAAILHLMSSKDKYIYLSMKKTPFFPAWRARLAPLKAAIQNARSQPLPYLQGLFGPWVSKEALVPPGYAAPAAVAVSSPWS